MPNQDERKAIFKVHLQNVRPQTTEDFQVEVLGSLTKDFSGAEIEQVVIDAMRLGFNQRREFTNDDLIRAIQTTVPLATTKNKELRITALATMQAPKRRRSQRRAKSTIPILPLQISLKTLVQQKYQITKASSYPHLLR